MLATLEHIPDESTEILGKHFPEYLKKLSDIVAKNIINHIIAVAPYVKASSKRRMMVRSLFYDEEGSRYEESYNVPDGQGGWKTVKVRY